MVLSRICFHNREITIFLYLPFAFYLLVTSYLYLALGVYVIAEGLMTRPGIVDSSAKPVGVDFVAFWAASQLARSGDPADVYVVSRLHQVEEAVIGQPIPAWAWNYPPTALLLMFPLSLAPYLASFALWITLPLLGCFWLTRQIAPHRLTPWLYLAFPFVLQNLFYGQNGFLSTLLLGGGLLLLNAFPLLAGCLFGLLSYKPQLTLLIPLALIAGRHWRALGATLASAAALALASLAVLGPATWVAFWHNLPQARAVINNPFFWEKMPTIFVSARLLGAGTPLATALQGLAALGSMAVVAWVWQRRPSLTWRGSILVLGIFLATPYAFEYDLAVLGLVFAWLGTAEYTAGRVGGQIFLIFCWISLFAANFPLREVTRFQATTVVLAALMGFIWYRVARLERPGSVSGA